MMKYLFYLLFIFFAPAVLLSDNIVVVTLAAGDKYQKIVDLGIQNKRVYCEMHGYNFYCCLDALDKSRPIPWSKIPLILQIMEESDAEWIFWTDADSIVMNLAIPLEELIDDNYHFILCKDQNDFNTGQFLIRNCAWSRDFLENVYFHEEFINHPWWEQRAIIEELNTKEEIRSQTKVIDQRLLNSYAEEVCGFFPNITFQTGDFIVHFAGVHDKIHLSSLFEHYSRMVVNDRNLCTMDYQNP